MRENYQAYLQPCILFAFRFTASGFIGKEYQTELHN